MGPRVTQVSPLRLGKARTQTVLVPEIPLPRSLIFLSRGRPVENAPIPSFHSHYKSAQIVNNYGPLAHTGRSGRNFRAAQLAPPQVVSHEPSDRRQSNPCQLQAPKKVRQSGLNPQYSTLGLVQKGMTMKALGSIRRPPPPFPQSSRSEGLRPGRQRDNEASQKFLKPVLLRRRRPETLAKTALPATDNSS